MSVQREEDEDRCWTLEMKIEEMNREVLYQCSPRNNEERHPCLTSGEGACAISIALSKWKP